MRVVSFDTETFYDSKAGYGIKELGVDAYCRDPRFDCYLLSVSDGSETWAGEPRNFNWSALDGATLVSHNAGFDKRVHTEMAVRGKAPVLNLAGWHCSANMSAFLSNRRSLKDAAAFLLGVTLSKETRDYANGKHWEDMMKDGRSDEMLAYGRSDALHCHQLFTRYGHLWPERERALSELTISQCARGIQIDVPRLETYIVIATQMLDATEQTLPWMKEGKKPTSPKAIAEECRKVGIPCPPVKSHDGGEEAFAQWEAIYGPKHPWITNVAAWRSLNKFLESLQTIHLRLMPDGVFSFGLKYGGAHTMRWSGDSGLNMQNLRKAPLYRDENGLLITDAGRLLEIGMSKTPPPYVTAELDIRSLFIARPGKKLILSDLEQIEPRVLAWVIQDADMLSRMSAGKSPYQSHAEATLGWTRGDMKAAIKAGDGEAKELYALAKARVLGLGYGCGWKKFVTVAQVMAQLDITKGDPEFVPALNEHGEPMLDADQKPIMLSGYGHNSKRIVREYREQNPKIVALWRTLDEAFKGSVNSHFEMTLPSGRAMRYLDVRRECRTVKNEESGKLERKWMTTAMIGPRRFSLYGGLLCENLVQATARDVFGGHLLELQKTSGVNVLFSCHDEAICEVDQSVSAKDIQSVMSVAPDWMPGLPVAAEAKEVKCYCK